MQRAVQEGAVEHSHHSQTPKRRERHESRVAMAAVTENTVDQFQLSRNTHQGSSATRSPTPTEHWIAGAFTSTNSEDLQVVVKWALNGHEPIDGDFLAICRAKKYGEYRFPD